MSPKQILGLSPDEISKLKFQLLRAKAAAAAELIDQGRDLDVAISIMKEVFEAIKLRLRDIAESKLADQGIKDLPGASWEESGTRDAKVLVSFPKPSLVSAFWFKPDGKAWTTRGDEQVCLGDLRQIAGKKFDALFLTNYKPCVGFTEVVPRVLEDTAAATALIAACTGLPGVARVAFKLKVP